MGTANALARELGIPLSPKKALNLLTEGKEKKVSAGKATFLEKGYSSYFPLMVEVNFDTEVVHSDKDAEKKHF